MNLYNLWLRVFPNRRAEQQNAMFYMNYALNLHPMILVQMEWIRPNYFLNVGGTVIKLLNRGEITVEGHRKNWEDFTKALESKSSKTSSHVPNGLDSVYGIRGF